MNAQEFREQYIDSDGEVTLKCVDMDEIVNGKYIHRSYYYPIEDQFFCVEKTESNVGYWGDSDTISTEVYEVESVVKTINAWRAI